MKQLRTRLASMWPMMRTRLPLFQRMRWSKIIATLAKRFTFSAASIVTVGSSSWQSLRNMISLSKQVGASMLKADLTLLALM